MQITKWAGKLSKYMVAINTDKLKELGYEYNTSTAIWTKEVDYTEVFDKDDSFDDSKMCLEIVPSGELRVRYTWELYSAQDKENYGGLMEVSILDEVMDLHNAGLLVKRAEV